MPIYPYLCSECGFEKDYLQKVSDPLLTDCPQCGKAALAKQLTVAGFQLKGSGWYATDFKNGAKPAAASADSAKGDAAPAAANTDADKSGAPKTDAGKSESGKSESGKSESGKSESGKSESGKSDGGKSAAGDTAVKSATA